MRVKEQVAVIVGDESVLGMAHWAVARLCARPLASVTVLDCGGVFDPYAVATIARRHGDRSAAVLQRVWVCRAFTGYQQLNVLRRLTRVASGRRLYVLNPLQLLVDPDLPGMDVPWLLNRLLAGLGYLEAYGHHVRVWQQALEGRDAAEGRVLQQALTRRFLTVTAQAGQLRTVTHGQECGPLQPCAERTGSGIPALPPRAAQGRSGAHGHAL